MSDFSFRARCEYRDGRLDNAVVRYDGGDTQLRDGARQVGVTVEPAKADKNGNPRIKISGGNVESALREYATRAGRAGAYTL